MITPQQQTERLEYLVKLQMTEIDRQRAEIDRLRAEIDHLVDWIVDDRDALAVLQSVYSDRRVSEASRIRAAAAALPFERAKLTVNVQVGPGLLGERLDGARAMKTIEPRTIEHQPTA